MDYKMDYNQVKHLVDPVIKNATQVWKDKVSTLIDKLIELSKNHKIDLQCLKQELVLYGASYLVKNKNYTQQEAFFSAALLNLYYDWGCVWQSNLDSNLENFTNSVRTMLSAIKMLETTEPFFQVEDDMGYLNEMYDGNPYENF